MATIRDLQKRAWENKINHHFNTTNVEREFCLLEAEVSEAYLSWLRREKGLDLELADVAIYLFGLAEMNNIDLEEAIETKMKINEQRKYKKVNGVFIKDEN